MTTDEHVAHLLTLALIRGWRDYVADRLDALEPNHTGIREKLNQAIADKRRGKSLHLPVMMA